MENASPLDPNSLPPILKNSPAISTAKLKSALPPRPPSSNPLKRKLSMEPANLVSSFPLPITFSGIGFLVSRQRSQADKSGGFFLSLVVMLNASLTWLANVCHGIGSLIKLKLHLLVFSRNCAS